MVKGLTSHMEMCDLFIYFSIDLGDLTLEQVQLFNYSFIHLFIYSFIHLFIYSFIHLII